MYSTEYNALHAERIMVKCRCRLRVVVAVYSILRTSHRILVADTREALIHNDQQMTCMLVASCLHANRPLDPGRQIVGTVCTLLYMYHVLSAILLP